MNKIAVYLMLVAFSFQAISCASDSNKEVTTDLVDNPKTADSKAETGSQPAIEFDKEEHDFGKISQGEKVSYSFKFKNTGEADLLISSAQGSCGCTVPDYPTKPIAPGEAGKIDVVFDSEGKSGHVKKTVTVVTNATPSTKVLTISTEILDPKPTE